MEQRIHCLGLLLLLLVLFTPCEARKSLKHSRSRPHGKSMKKKHFVAHLSTPGPDYLGSPYYMLPFEDVMSPSASPQENPPYCVYPPLTPLPPSTTVPTPIMPIQSPPSPSTSTTPSPPIESPPGFTPFPPEFPTPSSPEIGFGPPSYGPSPPGLEPSPPGLQPGPPSYEPSPPGLIPSPPGFNPGPPESVPLPPGFSPGPPIFLPPIVYPPPTGRAPPRSGTRPGLWCVAKPTVPDPIIQEAMNYACGSGANCDAIQPNGACYQPDTLLAHASFAFNSYWQRTKVAGGNCDFGGTAMLITKDPSYDGCLFTIR